MYRRVMYLGCFALLCVAIVLISFAFRSVAHTRAKSAFADGYSTCISAGSDPIERGRCFRSLAKRSVRTLSPVEIESSVTNLQSEVEREWCHEFMHYAGWDLYDASEDFATAFDSASEACDSGMKHGVVEEFASREASGRDVSGLLQASYSACGAGTSPGVQAACYHGIGHAFMILSDSDLARSLSLCDRVDRYRTACDGGVYMEFMKRKHVDIEGKVFEDQSPSELLVKIEHACTQASEEQKNACYRFVGTAHFLSHTSDLPQAFKGCASIPNPHRADCFWGLGGTFVSPGFTTADAAHKCEYALPYGTESYHACINGGITDVVQESHENATRATEYCDAVRSNERQTCESDAAALLAEWQVR